MRLPHGPVTEWDMNTLTDDQLEHEYQLSYEVLHDIHCSFPPWNGGVAIKGLLKQIADGEIKEDDHFKMDAVRTWKLRLQRAEDEYERRILLS